MDFGKAIEAMKAGRKVAREGWNGKKMAPWLARITNRHAFIRLDGY